MSDALRVLEIEPTSPLDRITVFLQDLPNMRGQMTVISFGMAWTMYLNAMGCDHVIDFICKADADYIANKLHCYQRKLNKRETVLELKHLHKIATAIKNHIAVLSISEPK